MGTDFEDSLGAASGVQSCRGLLLANIRKLVNSFASDSLLEG